MSKPSKKTDFAHFSCFNKDTKMFNFLKHCFWYFKLILALVDFFYNFAACFRWFWHNFLLNPLVDSPSKNNKILRRLFSSLTSTEASLKAVTKNLRRGDNCGCWKASVKLSGEAVTILKTPSPPHHWRFLISQLEDFLICFKVFN